MADVIVVEAAYVLQSFYEAPRTTVALAIRALLGMKSVKCVDPDLLLRSIEVYETERLDFAEAYLVACAETTGLLKISSFDQSNDRITTVERIEP